MALTSCSDPLRQVNFQQLSVPSTPNYYLLCPQHYCKQQHHAVSPIYAVAVVQLQQAWEKMVMRQPRTTCVAADPTQRQYTYVQRTRWLRFPDTINVKLLSIATHQSTLAIYSRSKYGYSDLGVNKKRVCSWLQQLQAEVNKLKKR